MNREELSPRSTREGARTSRFATLPAFLGAALLAGLAGCAAGGGGGSRPGVPQEVVREVDLDRYLGTWYEIARYPNRFQRGCTATTATYSLREDGGIRVLNRCRAGDPAGPLREAEGKAWVVDLETGARLKVQFFWPFRGDYWIIGLGENYEYAVVGHPRRKYLWVLSRTPEMDPALYETALESVRRNGYDPSKLVLTVHHGSSAADPPVH